MTSSETQSAIAQPASAKIAQPPQKTTELTTGLQNTLHQALKSSQTAQWSQVITLCEAAIAQCHQQLHLETNAALAAETSAQAPASLHRIKGDLFRREGRPKEAIQAYHQALQHEPQQADLQAQLADLYAQQQRWTAATHHYQQAFELDPTVQQGKAALKLAVLYSRQQQWDQAIACYHQAIPLCPPQHQAELQLRLAELLTQQEQWDRAVPHYQAALQHQPDLTKAKAGLAKAQFQLGRQHKQHGNVHDAVMAYLQAIEQQPYLSDAYNQLRYNLMRYDMPGNHVLLPEIVSRCRQVAGDNPNFAPAHIALGYALTKQGETAAAMACYRAISDRLLPQPAAGAEPWRDVERRGPNFIIIGAEKCGTSSLYHYLRRHPAMLPPIEKEIDFFDIEYEQGLDWYLAHFPAIPRQGGWLTGETSPNYLYSGAAPERVHQHFPTAKLIVILRNPVDRTISRFNMMVRNGAERRSFEQAMSEEMGQFNQALAKQAGNIRLPLLNGHRHIGNSLYYYHLQRWLKYFSREQLLILRSEDLFEQPEATIQQLYQFLEIAHHSETSYPKHNAGDYPPIDATSYAELANFFKPHTQKLENLIGQSLNW